MCISFDASLVAISGAADAGMSVSECAPEPAHNRHLKIASFNFGYDQAIMNGHKAFHWRSSFVRVCVTLVQNINADLLFCCEVGGFRQGFGQIDFAQVLTELKKGLRRGFEVLLDGQLCCPLGLRCIF